MLPLLFVVGFNSEVNVGLNVGLNVGVNLTAAKMKKYVMIGHS